VGGFTTSDAGVAVRTGRVVVVGVNPQASPGDRVYQAIRDADVATKMRLGDIVLDVYAGRQRFEHIDPAWTWMNAEHRGVKEWLPRFSDLFGLTAATVADHFTFVETFKHATADQAALSRLDEWKLIKKACPDLLHEQLRRLRPRLVVLCGEAGKNRVARFVLSEAEARAVRRSSGDVTHGTQGEGRLDDLQVPVLFTYAVSGQTVGAWRAHPRTQTVRETVRRHLSAAP
jgi:hypothetical protein